MMNYLKKIYYNKYSKKSFSISNVDLVINRIFKNLNNGIYIDIGCNHPIKYNNTYLLYKRGWKGINVDLDQKSIEEFNQFRPNDYNISSLVSDKSNEDKEIYIYHERSAINTISKELVDSRIDKPKTKIVKRTKTLNDIIFESPFNNKKINFLTIDVENHEYEVLKNFEFKKYDIDIIVTELHDISKKIEIYTQSLDYITSSNLYKLLTNNNYKLINWIHSDLVFAKKNLKL